MRELFMSMIDHPVAARVVPVLIAAVVLFLIRAYVMRAIERRTEDNVLRYRAHKLSTWLVSIGFVVVGGFVFSDYLTGLGVALGVVGAGVAFALQEVIVSVAGWIAIVSGGYYRTGDRVRLGGIKGDVIDVGVVRTTLFELGDWVGSDNYNGSIVRIANSFVFKEPVYNYSADFTFLWDEVRIPVRHESDQALARSIVTRVGNDLTLEYARGISSTWANMTKKYMIEPARVEPSVSMVFDENWVTFTLRYVVGLRERRGKKDQIFQRILEEFAQTDGKVKVATASQEVTVLRADSA